MLSPQLLTPTEAAEHLAVSPRTLEKWRTAGNGPRFVALTRKAVRYRPDDLTAWVNARAVANTAHALAKGIAQ